MRGPVSARSELFLVIQSLIIFFEDFLKYVLTGLAGWFYKALIERGRRRCWRRPLSLLDQPDMTGEIGAWGLGVSGLVLRFGLVLTGFLLRLFFEN